MYEEYKKHYTNYLFGNGIIETGNALLNNMKKENKMKRWEEVIISINMTHNSYKAWKIIQKNSNNHTSSNAPCLKSANQVANQLLINSSGTMSNKPKPYIISPTAEKSVVYPFSEE